MSSTPVSPKVFAWYLRNVYLWKLISDIIMEPVKKYKYVFIKLNDKKALKCISTIFYSPSFICLIGIVEKLVTFNPRIYNNK